VFGRRSQPIERVIDLINPVLRGWVNYFAVGIPASASASSKTVASLPLILNAQRSVCCNAQAHLPRFVSLRSRV
jgi:hypothetical protein